MRKVLWHGTGKIHQRSVVFAIAALLISYTAAGAQSRGSLVSPGENFFHSVGFWTPAERQGDYDWIQMQEQLLNGYPLGTTFQFFNFQGGLSYSFSTAIGVYIANSPGAVGGNAGPVNAQSNMGSNGGTASGSIDQHGSATTNYLPNQQTKCVKECKE